jgi:hypothetical protein
MGIGLLGTGEAAVAERSIPFAALRIEFTTNTTIPTATTMIKIVNKTVNGPSGWRLHA